MRRGYGRHLRTTTRKSIVIPPTGIGEDSGNKASLEALDPTASLRTLRGRFAAASKHGHAFAGGPPHPLFQSGHAAASARHCRENVTPNPDPDPISAVGDEAGGKSRLSLLKAHCPSPHRRRQLGHIMERIVLNGVGRSPSILRPIGETDELHVNRPSYLRSADAGQRARSPFVKESRIRFRTVSRRLSSATLLGQS